MKKKMLVERAKEIVDKGEFLNCSGNEIWKNNFYRINGFLFNIQYKNGRLFDVIAYGR